MPALSCPLAGEEEVEDFCAVGDSDILRHWNKKELLAAQLEVHQMLAAADRLASTPNFSWIEKGEEVVR